MDEKVDYFNTIKRFDTYVNTWDYIEIDSMCRLYYKPGGEYEGFDFYSAEFHSSENCDDDNWWVHDSLRCNCLFEGVAYWDGLRHFYAGDERTDNYGYLYYISIRRMRDILEALEGLMKKYCREYT